MNAFEIVVGVLLILLCAAIALLIEMQEGSKGGMQALVGGQSEGFGRNAGKTLSATLKTMTKYAAAALMIMIILVNVVHVYF